MLLRAMPQNLRCILNQRDWMKAKGVSIAVVWKCKTQDLQKYCLNMYLYPSTNLELSFGTDCGFSRIPLSYVQTNGEQQQKAQVIRRVWQYHIC